MHLKLNAAMKSDVGQQREQNEDDCFKRIVTLEDGDHGLFIVADGMGGYKAGEVASRLAVEKISTMLENFFKPIEEQPTIQLSRADLDPDATIKIPAKSMQSGADPLTTQKFPETSHSLLMENQLKEAILAANRAILQYGEQQAGARGLGCTVTAVLVQNDHAYIANVGDSRTYLLRDKQLTPITRDHSLVARLVESKQIEPEEVYTHPQRNLIYRSLGAGHKNVDVDIFQQTLKPGDVLLLCCDGLWEMVHDGDLRTVLVGNESPQQKCNTLIDLANKNGGEDNITAVVVQVDESK
jgi:serine/threonine protein phosphatase PrpC